jgi:hypothetical protein
MKTYMYICISEHMCKYFSGYIFNERFMEVLKQPCIRYASNNSLKVFKPTKEIECYSYIF